ncbi:MAG TPA: glycosyltransferase family 39 protein [Candidatus Xenobia bacterium]
MKTPSEGWRLAAVLALSAFLRWYRLDVGGWSPYFAAAVRSMQVNWHNFVFASFDPGGFITTDKPPGALWVQAISAAALGFCRFSVLWPQAMAGVLSTGLVYWIVRRSASTETACLAALFYAVCPAAVVVDRSNLPDGLLICLLLLASAVWISGRVGWAAVLVGLAFNVKWMAAWLIVPALLATGSWRWRDLGLFVVTLLVVSLGWSAWVDSVPKDQRPRVDESANDSMLDTALVWDGISRLPASWRARLHVPSRGGYTDDQSDLVTVEVDGHTTELLPPGRMPGPGPVRLLLHPLVGQHAWLLPLLPIGLVWGRRDRSFRLWAGWLGTVWLAWSCIRWMHPHYMAMLAPPEAALAALGWEALRARSRGFQGLVACVAGLWPATVMASGRWDLWPLSAAIVIMALAWAWRPSWVGLAALCIGPLTWLAYPVLLPEDAMFPVAGPRSAGPERPPDLRPLAHFLEIHQGRAHYMAALDSTSEAAALILDSGRPVIPLTTYTDRVNTLTPQALADLVDRHEVRYFVLRANPTDALSQAIRRTARPVWEDPLQPEVRVLAWPVPLKDTPGS